MPSLIMSVPTWKRNESKVQFLDTAFHLVEFTLTHMKKFPKSATFYICVPVMENARNIYKYCCTANARFPKCEEDIKFRKDQLNLALGELDSMDASLTIAFNAYSISLRNDSKESVRFTSNELTEWGELIHSERNLIIKLLESDAKRDFSKN